MQYLDCQDRYVVHVQLALAELDVKQLLLLGLLLFFFFFFKPPVECHVVANIRFQINA